MTSLKDCPHIGKNCMFLFEIDGELKCGQAKGMHSPHSNVEDAESCDGRQPKYKKKRRR